MGLCHLNSSVIELRRRPYDDAERNQMIGSSVTASQWLDHIPTGRRKLVVADGKPMYLRRSDVRQLLDRLTLAACTREELGPVAFSTGFG
ncbi:hypothetical protein BST25_11310 [Mycobacterium heidelbergense]|uniref:Uncharacterized protein n=1 Tax=Mycobacterium heidelbergense TaxID=53376 RepID=A0A1X0DP84_MYCHE|nr:hypothetical protein BST25_11310 [Mycobacterium heidelbergense]BBZ52656.1 hypothetical protein MHEI_43730 [Mycobacterium heidelbergense]